MDDLTDVVAPSPTAGSLLVYNGTNWVDAGDPITGIAPKVWNDRVNLSLPDYDVFTRKQKRYALGAEPQLDLALRVDATRLVALNPTTGAVDAAGLLRTAIRCEDPVLFLEHKHLYRQVYNKGKYPGPNFMIPFGKAKKVREGTDVTVIACGALVQRSLVAAKVAEERHGISTEVIDLRSLSPFDMETIAESVMKTNRVIVAHEDSLSWGIGAEIVARISDELFPWLDAPVKRVASLDTWVAYAPLVERATLPETEDVLAAIEQVKAF